MITSIAISFLLINGLVVIPGVNISSPIEIFQNQLKQLPNSNQISGTNQNFNSLVLSTARLVANLPVLNMADVVSFKQYQNYADKFNTAINILNEGKLDIHSNFLRKTQDAYEKISKTLTKFSPDIKEGNDMILAAKKAVHNPTQESINDFYSKAIVFAFAVSVTVAIVDFAPEVAIPIAWRASGLPMMAAKCLACMSFAVDQANLFIKNSFVGATANILSSILDTLSKPLILPKIFQQANQFINKINQSNLIPQIHK